MPVKPNPERALPPLNPTAMRKLQDARAAAEKLLKTNPKDREAKKKMAKCDASLASYEQALSNALDKFSAKLKELAAARTFIGRLSPMPDLIRKGLD